MAIYIVRPYYGHDCDSEMGFNNGAYLDPIEVEADDEDTAAAKAMDNYIAETYPNGVPDDVELDGHTGDWTIYRAHSYVDNAGADITAEQYNDLDDDKRDGAGYLYEFLDFSQDVTLKGNDK